MVRLHSPATGRLQILELKITKLILTKKSEAALLARSEDWQQHSELQHREPQEPRQVQLQQTGSVQQWPDHSRRASPAALLPQAAFSHLQLPTQPCCCCDVAVPPSGSGIKLFSKAACQSQSHSRGLTTVRNIPPSSIKHWNNIPDKNLYQGLSLGRLTPPDVTSIHTFGKPCDPTAPNYDVIPNPLSPLFTWIYFPVRASVPGPPHQTELFLPPNMRNFSLSESCFDVLGFSLPCCWGSLSQAVLSQAGNVPWVSLSTCQHLSQGQGPCKAATSSCSLPTKLIRAQLHQKRHIQSLFSVHQTTPLHWGEAESLPATSSMSVESSLVLSVYYLYCFPKFPFCTSEIPHSFLRTVHFLLGFLHCFIAIPPHFTQNSLQLPGNLWVIFSELTFCFLGVLPQLSKNSIFLSNDFSLFFHEFSVVF